MINKTALINQHIYEIEKLRHDLIVTQTKNGLYLSEDGRAEIRHKSESKSGNSVDSRRKIDHSPIDFETSDDDEVIARRPPMLLTKTGQAREPSKSLERIKCEARVRVRGLKVEVRNK
ncbi:hypothetical protein PPACK8108_LOCUS20468 [Phakopsora pachyrhizi]|uniref:Uncharacterized protein n=1 Tax=Phakopsora pachyrhizi TaxID=170000 RepID=A0AAV0BHW0_PHAPC|nr:hypothetical protein PPACK8108_LOCUS20468 [Phakopsora pachyrhizi]